MRVIPWLNAYGESYDPKSAIEAWRTGLSEVAARELWHNLYHQGVVGSASYAAVGEIVRMMQEQTEPDWVAYAIVASIEEGRLNEESPSIPPELQQDYERAWASILPMALRVLQESTEDLIVRSAFAVIAHAKGQRTLATIALCTEDERIEMLRG